MSTKHVVHRIIEPGLSGDGIDDAESALLRKQVGAVRTVSADWYSNVNDAVAEAAAPGNGGIVKLSRDVTYDAEDIELPSGVRIEGESPRTSVLRVAGTGIRAHNPSSLNTYASVRNLTLRAAVSGEGVGIDARGMTRFLFENVYAEWFEVGIWFGGDNPAYHSSWTGTANKGEILVPVNGSAVRFSGSTSGGASTANNIAVRDFVINLDEAATSIGIDMISGDTNLIEHCDIGYGRTLSLPYYLGPKSRYNMIVNNRSEAVDRSVVIEGGMYNGFINNLIGGDHATVSPVVITASGTDLGYYNAFTANAYSRYGRDPYIDEQGGPGSRKTFINDKLPGSRRRTNWETVTHTVEQEYERPPGSYMFSTRRADESNRRFGISADGRLTWMDPETGRIMASIGGSAGVDGYISTSGNTYFMIPNHESLPAPSSVRIGSLIRVGGTLYFCESASSWKKL